MRKTPIYGSGRVIETYVRSPVRMWAVPVGQHTAWPTPVFYNNRTVIFSNEGNALHPIWVALNRNNDDDWDVRHWYVDSDEMVSLRNTIARSKEGLDLRCEPAVRLPPAPVGPSWVSRLAAFLPRLVR